MNVALGIDRYRVIDRRLPPSSRARYTVARFVLRGGKWRRVYKLTGPLKLGSVMRELQFHMMRTGLPLVPETEGSTMATIFPGFILAQISNWARKDAAADDAGDKIIIDGHQSNGMYCVHQARAMIKGDPTVYRILVAPANAPIFINDDKRPIDEAFAQPLGDF